MDKNKELALKLGMCWHEYPPKDTVKERFCIYCKKHVSECDNTLIDFTTPDGIVLLLRGMMKREDWDEFCLTSFGTALEWFIIDYILDTTGKLRDVALSWLENKS